MSKELASLTLGDAEPALLLEWATPGSAGTTLAGFTTVADYGRLCLAYPKGHGPAARMFSDARGIHKAAVTNTPLLLREVLEAASTSIHDVDHVITHQTSARAIGKGMTKLSESFGDKPAHDAVIGWDSDDVDLLINAGIYRDPNLTEPALAALIQQDIGANPEDPHVDAHGTFSFDITNGTCGLLNGLQIVDGFLNPTPSTAHSSSPVTRAPDTL